MTSASSSRKVLVMTRTQTARAALLKSASTVAGEFEKAPLQANRVDLDVERVCVMMHVPSRTANFRSLRARRESWHRPGGPAARCRRACTRGEIARGTVAQLAPIVAGLFQCE